MYSEHGQTVDIEDVQEAVTRADVLIVGFAAMPERLLVDSRTSDADGPMVRVVEPLGGVEERMHWLGRTRPRFGMPDRFTFFVWPHSIQRLDDTGVSAALQSSVMNGDGPQQLDAALLDLRRLERIATRAAINGEPWKTLWHVRGTTKREL